MDGRSCRLSGPLMPYRAGFAGDLARLGYAHAAVRQQLVLFGRVSRWSDPPGTSLFSCSRSWFGRCSW